MNQTEELIKAALTKHVEGTPHAGPILTALNRRRRRIRPTLIAIIAATAVAAGIALPIALQKPEASAPPAETPTPMPVEPSKGLKMRYVLQPLPGYTERKRTASLDGSFQIRVWMKDTCPPGKSGPECAASLSLVMYTDKHPYFAETIRMAGDSVALPGARVSTDSRGTMAKLVMQPAEPGTVLQLTLFDPAGDAKQNVVKLAHTVGVDNAAAVQAALSFGWLPAELSRTVVVVRGGSPSTAEPGIQALMADSRSAAVEANIVPKATDDPAGGMLAVRLPDGRQVQVHGYGASRIPLQQLRRIADNLKAEPRPDTSWVGR